MPKKNVLVNCFVKEEDFKPVVLEGDSIRIRELTVAEHLEYREILNDETKTQKDAIYYAVSKSMVEPLFFTPAELEKLTKVGETLIYEVFAELPIIGKTQKQKEDYKNDLKKQLENNKDNPAEITKEDEEKK